MKPFVITVDDYHEFSFVHQVLKAQGFKGTKHEEIGLHNGVYVAVFYQKKDAETIKLIKEQTGLVNEEI